MKSIVSVLVVLALAGAPVIANERVANTTPEVQIALALLAEHGEKNLPTVIVTDSAQNPQARGKIGFALHPGGKCVPSNSIYLVKDSELYQLAIKYRVYNVLLSAVILHEGAHCQGADEEEALRVEVKYLTKLARDAKVPAEKEVLMQNIASISRAAEEAKATKAIQLARR